MKDSMLADICKDLKVELRNEIRQSMMEAVSAIGGIPAPPSYKDLSRETDSPSPPPPPPLPDMEAIEALERREDYAVPPATAPPDEAPYPHDDEAARQFFTYPPPPSSPFIEETRHNRHWYTQL